MVMVAALTRVPMVDAATLERRLACCASCADYRAADDRCVACGCLVRIKAAVKFTDCPRGLWAAAGKEKQ